MRQKRAKAYRKQMNIYLHTFKFREPFQTIVDDELVLNCDKAQFDLVKGLERTIQAEAKPMITQCCMQALYATDNQRAIDMAKRFERRRCNHPPKDPKPLAECIESIVNIDGLNKHRYVVASQSTRLRRRLRSVPGVPLIFMNRSVMVMEPASDSSKRAAALSENAKLNEGLNDSKVGYVDKDKDKEEASEEPMKKKRKGPSEPNPLSVRKKKTVSKPEDEPKMKRVRRHGKKGEGKELNGPDSEEKEEREDNKEGETTEKAETKKADKERTEENASLKEAEELT